MAAFWIVFAPLTVLAFALVAGLATVRRALVVGAVGALASLGLFVLAGGGLQPGAAYADRLAGLSARAPETLSPPERLVLMQSIARERAADPLAHKFLGDEYGRAGRWFEAASAYDVAARLDPSPEHLSAFGRATVALNDGAVTQPARQAFAAALQRNPAHPDAGWFLALGDHQDGEIERAEARWAAVFADAPPDAPAVIRRALATVEILSQPRRGPVGMSGNAAPASVEAPFAAAIQGDAPDLSLMVERARVRADASPDQLAPSLVLAHALSVTGDAAGAVSAIERAQERFASDPGRLVLLEAARTRIMRAAAAGEEPAQPARQEEGR